MANTFLGYPDLKTIDFIDINYPFVSDGIWHETNAFNSYLYIFNEAENLWRMNVSIRSTAIEDYDTIRYDNDNGYWINYNGYNKQEYIRYLHSYEKQIIFLPYEHNPLIALWYPNRSYVQTIGGYWINNAKSITLSNYILTDNEVKWTRDSSSNYPYICHNWTTNDGKFGGHWNYGQNKYISSQSTRANPKSTELIFYNNNGLYLDTFTWHNN